MESQRSTVILQELVADPKARETFERFVRKYQARIKGCCLGLGLQDAGADDLTSAILLRFLGRNVVGGFVFQSKEKFYAWLDTVVRTAVRTLHRDRARKPEAWSMGNADAED